MLRKVEILPHRSAKHGAAARSVVMATAFARCNGLSAAGRSIVNFRDLSRPNELADETIMRTAMIADAAYGFYDLVLRCTDVLENRKAIKPAALDPLKKRLTRRVAEGLRQ